MIDKRIAATDGAVADIFDGAVVMVGGFGAAGQPAELLDALIRRKPRELTLISNNAGNGDYGLAALLKAGCVKKVICSFPRQTDSWVFDDLYRRGEVALEPRHIDGKDYVLEYPLKADFALIKALKADRWGNLVYDKTGRNFGPIMAAAANCTIAQVSEIVALGELDPEAVVTPGIFVQRVVSVATARLPQTA